MKATNYVNNQTKKLNNKMLNAKFNLRECKNKQYTHQKQYNMRTNLPKWKENNITLLHLLFKKKTGVEEGTSKCSNLLHMKYQN